MCVICVVAIKVASREVSGLREQLAEVGRANELLHSQVQTYGAQIERLQESRLAQGEQQRW